jgi:hypothetical protein
MFWDVISLALFTSLCIFGIGFGLSRLGDRKSDKK